MAFTHIDVDADCKVGETALKKGKKQRVSKKEGDIHPRVAQLAIAEGKAKACPMDPPESTRGAGAAEK